MRFAEIRATLDRMCSGVERCMYCEDSSWTAIEHFVPRAMDPLLTFEWTNYLAACSECNSNHKRDEFPRADDGSPNLIEPTLDEPASHLEFSPTTGRYVAVSESLKGSESIRVFGLNRPVLAKGRRDAWHVIQLTIIAYAEARDAQDDARAARLTAIVRRQPFAGVLKALVRMAGSGDAIEVLAECEQAMECYPEIRGWPHALYGAP